jgi:protein-disulfide isomerase
MHKNTWDASLAAACANDQGKFWQMHDAIFQNQDRWNGEATSRPRPVLSDLAKGIGLDMSKYDACMDADTHRAKIQAHLQEAERRQVNQTPTFVIGDKLVPGALPYDAFKKLVDDELAKTPVRTDSTVKPAATSAADSAPTTKKKAGAK